MGCVKAHAPSKAKISCEYYYIPFLTKPEMQTFTAPNKESVVGHKEEGKATKITPFSAKSSASPKCTQHHSLSLPILSQEHWCHSNKHQHKYVCFNLHMIIFCAYCLPYPIFPTRSSFSISWFHLGLFMNVNPLNGKVLQYLIQNMSPTYYSSETNILTHNNTF